MPDNILNQVQDGKVCNYEQLKSQWNGIKDNPKDSNYGFLGSIFAMDDDKNSYSSQIYDEIAKCDGKDGISSYDIDKLAEMYTQKSYIENPNSKDISKEDFKLIYDKLNVQNNQKINPFYVKSGDKYLSEDDAKNLVANKVEISKQKILDYATKHPNDEKIQEYAKLLSTTKFTYQKAAGPVLAGIVPSDVKTINFYYNHQEYFGDEKYTTAIMLHELEHVRTGDIISSKTEEATAEKYAVEITRDIYNIDNVYGDDAKHIEKYGKAYTKLPDFSPGYGGIPLKLGVIANGNIESIKKNKHTYLIKSKDNDVERTYKVILDKNGNPIKAVETQKTATVKSKAKLFNYSEKTHSFLTYKRIKAKIIKT